jgi:hypothetical protein
MNTATLASLDASPRRTFRKATAIYLATLLPVLAACGDVAIPEGRQLAQARHFFRSLAADTDRLYFIDFEVTSGSKGMGVLRSVSKEGGQVLTLARSQAENGYPRTEIVTDGTHVYWIDRCPADPPSPTCARIRRIAKSGSATPELLVQDRIFALALDESAIYFTTSDELGLQTGTPDGVLYRLDKAGGAPVMVAEGLTHLRHVAVDPDYVYWTDTTADGRTDRLVRLSKTSGQETVLATTNRQGGVAIGEIALDDRFVYFTASRGIHRASKAGGTVDTILSPTQNGQAGIAVDDQHVYWTNPGRYENSEDGPSTYFHGAVERVSKVGGTPTTVARGQREPNRIVVDARRVYWAIYGNDDPVTTPGLIRTIDK